MDIFGKVLAVGPLTFLSWPPDTSGEVYFVGSRGGNVCTMSPPFKVPTNFALYCVVGCLQRKVRWGKEVCGIDCGEESLARKGGWVVEEKEEKESEEKNNRKSLTSNLKGGHFDQRKQNIVKTTKQFFFKTPFHIFFLFRTVHKGGKSS